MTENNELNRDFEKVILRRLSHKTDFIQVVLGPRQVGKTTGIRRLLREHFLKSHYCSADLPAPPTPEWIIENWQKARILGEGAVLVIDEVQKVERWSEVVKALYDEDRTRRDLRIVLLGSASLSLQAGLSESLLGRYELVRVYHWDALESKQAFGWSLKKYLKYGGYPAPASLIDDTDRWLSFMRDGVVDALVSKDIFALKQIAQPSLFRQSFELAMSYPAQILSYQKFLGQLQDRGNAATVKSYLELLEKAFVLKILEKFSKKKIRTKSSSPKLIPLAPGLVSVFIHPNKIDTDAAWYGRVFEASIIAKALMSGDKITYWRHGRAEVDFIWEKGDKLLALEIKSGDYGMSSRGLEAFRKSYPEAKTFVLDRSFGEQFLFSNQHPSQFLEEIYDKS